jgi:TRAP-type C4-dicarboxylate transport system permease small subunit
MMLLITSDTVGRYFFKRPIHGTLEVSELYLMGAVVFFGMSYTLREGGHIRVELFFRNFRPLMKESLELLFGTLSLLLFAGITYRAFGFTYRAFLNDEVVFGIIEWPVYLSWLVVPLGTGMISLRLCSGIVQNMHLILDRIFGDK